MYICASRCGTAPDEGGGVQDFDAFVRAAWQPLLRSAVLLCGERHAAEDLVQETLVRLAQRWPRLVRGGADPMPYARTVLYRLWVDTWRRRRTRPETLVASAGDDPGAGRQLPLRHDALAVAVDRVALARALDRLTARQRAVLVLRYLEDRTEVETARVLGCSPNTVKSQARHALARMRELAPDVVAEFAAAGKETS